MGDIVIWVARRGLKTTANPALGKPACLEHGNRTDDISRGIYAAKLANRACRPLHSPNRRRVGLLDEPVDQVAGRHLLDIILVFEQRPQRVTRRRAGQLGLAQ